MKRVLAITACLAFAVAACSQSPKVAVSGIMLIAGGPVTAGGQSGPRPLVQLTVHVLGKGASETLKTDSSGVFHTMLRPGRYTVVLGTPGQNANEVQPRPNQIDVTSRGPNRFELSCSTLGTV